jgi:hypothetical protein
MLLVIFLVTANKNQQPKDTNHHPFHHTHNTTNTITKTDKGNHPIKPNWYVILVLMGLFYKNYHFIHHPYHHLYHHHNHYHN